MTFKINWEKADEQYRLPASMPEKMLQLGFPNKKVISHELISGGCANLNIKIQITDTQDPLILRIYLRDKDAAYREQKLGALLKQTVPVPFTYYVGDIQGYRFAITKFLPGITLRDLLLGELPHDVSAVMREVGTLLSKITAHKLPKAGFFDKDLNVIEQTSNDCYIIYAKKCLKNKIILSQLTPKMILK